MKIGFETKGLIRNIEKIPAIYKTIIVLAIAIALLSCFIYFLAKPQWETREQLQKEYSNLRNELDKVKAIKDDLEKHRREYRQMQEKLQDILKQLPETRDIPNLLRNITSVGEQTRLKIKYFEPKGIKHKDFYSELPFEIKFRGPFHATASFFDDVRRMDRLVNVTGFVLEAKGTPSSVVLEGSCTANAYVYQKDRPKTQKKR